MIKRGKNVYYDLLETKMFFDFVTIISVKKKYSTFEGWRHYSLQELNKLILNKHDKLW